MSYPLSIQEVIFDGQNALDMRRIFKSNKAKTAKDEGLIKA